MWSSMLLIFILKSSKYEQTYYARIREISPLLYLLTDYGPFVLETFGTQENFKKVPLLFCPLSKIKPKCNYIKIDLIDPYIVL